MWEGIGAAVGVSPAQVWSQGQEGLCEMAVSGRESHLNTWYNNHSSVEKCSQVEP